VPSHYFRLPFTLPVEVVMGANDLLRHVEYVAPGRRCLRCGTSVFRWNPLWYENPPGVSLSLLGDLHVTEM
jgi:hypothetical protein